MDIQRHKADVPGAVDKNIRCWQGKITMLKEIKSRGLFVQRMPIFLILFFALLTPVVQGCGDEPFSFIVIGDTRTEPYLPGGVDQQKEMIGVLNKRYHNRPVDLFFDTSGLALARVEVGEKETGMLTLHYRDGWPRIIVNSSNGTSRVVMRDSGRRWVFGRIVSAVQRGARNLSGGALLIVHGGDIPVFGYQGRSLGESPYWQLFDDELLSRLPLPDKDLGLPGRLLAAVGNHETWEDEDITGMRDTMPWLKTLGLSKDRRIYTVQFRNCRFIFLDSGDFINPEDSAEKFPPFEQQMRFLTAELEKAKAARTDHVFIVYHEPSFVKVGHDPLPAKGNPHNYLKPFAADLNIIVLNSHTHTTEHYLVDNIRYLVMGGGGAPQKFELTTNPSPEEELYWQDQKRVEEYNYLLVEVEGQNIKGIIHRFRPTETQKPFSVVEVFRK